MSVVLASCSHAPQVVCLDGPLRLPVRANLERQVRARLDRGERAVVLDLSGVWTIDAAGVGELVRAYQAVSGVDGWFSVVNATPWVRQVLESVGLFGLLSACGDLEPASAACVAGATGAQARSTAREASRRGAWC